MFLGRLVKCMFHLTNSVNTLLMLKTDLIGWKGVLFIYSDLFSPGFGQKSGWQMSGQERSVEPPVTEDSRTTPSLSQWVKQILTIYTLQSKCLNIIQSTGIFRGHRSALKPENHAPVGYVFDVHPKASRFITKEKRKMRKTRKGKLFHSFPIC